MHSILWLIYIKGSIFDHDYVNTYIDVSVSGD